MFDTKPKQITPYLRRMYQLAERYSKASRLSSDQANSGEWGCCTPQMLTESLPEGRASVPALAPRDVGPAVNPRTSPR